MAKYLLVSSPIGGHVAPVRAVGAALARQGHRVRALTGSRFRSQIEDAGMTFLPMPEQADYDDTDLNGSFPGSAGLVAARQCDSTCPTCSSSQWHISTAPSYRRSTKSLLTASWPN